MSKSKGTIKLKGACMSTRDKKHLYKVNNRAREEINKPINQQNNKRAKSNNIKKPQISPKIFYESL